MSQLSAILIGANSGLSHALALELAKDNVRLGLMAADLDALQPLLEQLNSNTLSVAIDIQDPTACRASFEQLWHDLDGAALVVINTSVNGLDLSLPWELDQTVIDVNVTGFTALANIAFNKMVEQKYGQIAALTSIAGERGGPQLAFHASKAFEQSYLQGLRLHAQRLKLPITITDLRMGYLDKMQGRGSKRWSAPLPKVAAQCVKAMKKAKHTVYVTKRWRVISWLTALLPEFIYNKRKYKG